MSNLSYISVAGCPSAGNEDDGGGCRVVIDRPKGSEHPRYPEIVYPVAYGYLDGTSAMDGGGIDVWVGAGVDLAARPPRVAGAEAACQ